MQNKVITKAIEDAGSIDIDFDILNEGKPNPINIDTLGGYAASKYVRKDELDELLPNSGSIQVNYSVVGSLDEPENPTENMIWVQTENMNGYVLSKNEPKNPSDGFVWISLGDSSDVAFHTFKIGNIEVNEVFPLSAKQYIGDAWVEKIAKSYQGGKWVDWFVYLYNNGVLNFPLTSAVTKTLYSTTIEFNTDKIIYFDTNTAGNNGGFAFDNKIDVTDFKC